jgi:hypothetical protein
MLFNPRYGRIGLLAMPYFLIFSFWRVGGTINMLKKPTGWGKPERKGFAAANQSAKG